MPDTAEVNRYADAIMVEIHKDMRDGFPWGGEKIPPDVGSFARLHDYCDANDYVIGALADMGTPAHAGDQRPDGSELDDAEQVAVDAEHAMANAVMDEVDRRLATEARELGASDAPAPAEKFSAHELDTIRDVIEIAIQTDGFIDTTSGGAASPARVAVLLAEMSRIGDKAGRMAGRLG